MPTIPNATTTRPPSSNVVWAPTDMPTLQHLGHGPRSTQGTILIIVAGLSALLASLVLTFLMRMRSASEESAIILREAQARIMLVAGCSYILEAGRLGYDRDFTTKTEHTEAFGWLDVRVDPTTIDVRVPGNALIGPRDAQQMALYDNSIDPVTRLPSWPAPGGVVRCPMFCWQRPPFAITQTVASNPIGNVPGSTTFGLPYLSNPDPQPVVGNGWPGTVGASLFDDGQQGASRSDFIHGDPRPVITTHGRAWFRIYREPIDPVRPLSDPEATYPSRFIITCGAGGTYGFRTYQEVERAGLTDLFANSAEFFETMRAQESLLWYRVEWSAAVQSKLYHFLDDELRENSTEYRIDHYLQESMNVSQYDQTGWGYQRCQGVFINQVGTISWVQRLAREPLVW